MQHLLDKTVHTVPLWISMPSVKHTEFDSVSRSAKLKLQSIPVHNVGNDKFAFNTCIYFIFREIAAFPNHWEVLGYNKPFCCHGNFFQLPTYLKTVKKSDTCQVGTYIIHVLHSEVSINKATYQLHCKTALQCMLCL